MTLGGWFSIALLPIPNTSMKQTAFQLSLLLPTLFKSLPVSLAYKWPNPQIDEVDHNLYDQFGYQGNVIFGAGVPTCDAFFGSTTAGRQTAAEVRITCSFFSSVRGLL